MIIFAVVFSRKKFEGQSGWFVFKKNYLKTMKRIIDSTLVILSLMLIFGCKESKVGQGNPTKDSMSIDTDIKW